MSVKIRTYFYGRFFTDKNEELVFLMANFTKDTATTSHKRLSIVYSAEWYDGRFNFSFEDL